MLPDPRGAAGQPREQQEDCDPVSELMPHTASRRSKCRRREPSDHVELFYISQFIFLVALDNKGTEMTSNIETLTRLIYCR